ncbi:MAG: ATP-binding protein [bacterium]|nr:ATP-binding protein [bacterium]
MRPTRRLSVRTKLIIFLCAVSLLPLLLSMRVLIGLGGRSFSTLREMQVQEGLNQSMRSLNAAENRLHEAAQAVANWDELARVIPRLDSIWFSEKLTNWVPQSYKLDYLAICDPAGMPLQQWYANEYSDDHLPLTLSESDDSINAGIASTPQNLFLLARSEIKADGQNLGCLVFGRKITYRFLTELQTTPNQNLMIYYGGKLLATTDTSSAIPYIEPGEIFTKLVAQNGAYLYHAAEHDQLLGFTTLKNLQGIDVAALGWTSLQSPASFVQDAVNKILMTFGIPLLALVLLAALFLGLWIERPIRELSVTMAEISRTGDLSRRAPITGGGEISAMSQAFNQMLEKLARQYEELATFRTMILTMKEGVLIENNEHKIIYMNPRMEELLGIEFSKDSEVLQPFFVERRMTTKGERIIDERGFYTEEVEWTRWDGRRIQALKTTGQLEDLPGQVSGLLSTYVDITERNELEIELIEASRMAFMGLYSQGIIHNLSGPLNSVLGFSSLMCKHQPDAEIPARILADAQRMTDQIHTLGRRWQRTGAQAPELLNLNEMIHDEISFLEADLFFKHNVEKILELDRELPGIYGLYGDFSHALLNVMVNAIDALSERPSPRFVVRTRVEQNEIQIDIEDNGTGITEENLNKIFLPFFSTKRRDRKEGVNSGAGLGLPIARKVLEPYGVYFDVKSQPGEGTCMTLCIPVDRDVERAVTESIYREIPA